MPCIPPNVYIEFCKMFINFLVIMLVSSSAGSHWESCTRSQCTFYRLFSSSFCYLVKEFAHQLAHVDVSCSYIEFSTLLRSIFPFLVRSLPCEGYRSILHYIFFVHRIVLAVALLFSSSFCYLVKEYAQKLLHSVRVFQCC